MDLESLFDEINERWFDNELPPYHVTWSKRMKVAGHIDRPGQFISLGLEYHCHFPRDVRRTLKHEMVHLVHWNHDEEFRRECRRVGAAVRCKTYPGMFRPVKYLYECPSCGTTVRTRRRISSACARCGDGWYEERFRMRLVQHLR
jgi:predicted SprT family Zn-dependent metalloprotease